MMHWKCLNYILIVGLGETSVIQGMNLGMWLYKDGFEEPQMPDIWPRTHCKVSGVTTASEYGSESPKWLFSSYKNVQQPKTKPQLYMIGKLLHRAHSQSVDMSAKHFF